MQPLIQRLAAKLRHAVLTRPERCFRQALAARAARQARAKQRCAIDDPIASPAFNGAVGTGQRIEIKVAGQQG